MKSLKGHAGERESPGQGAGLLRFLNALRIRNGLTIGTLVLGLTPGEFSSAQSINQPELFQVGLSRIDITPDYPIRLSGFGGRRTESEGIVHRIWAKAMAIKDQRNTLGILITVDNLGLPDAMVREVSARLSKRATLPLGHLAVTSTHTHTAPMVRGVAPTLFGQPIPEPHQKRIDRYTGELTDNLERAAMAAIADLKPARMVWANGTVKFARNRRTAGGPVDHDLPVLFVSNPDGTARAVYFSYACHCVTLSHNKIGGDWAGFAQIEIEKQFPGALALASVGCGADSNPDSGVQGGQVDLAEGQGQQISREVARLWKGNLNPIQGKLGIQYQRLDLAFDTPRTRDEWQARFKQGGAVGYHAGVNLERLDHGETLPTKINVPIQSWHFGNDLALVFLPGEVVVDYSLRLKRELDRSRLWLNGYSNDLPGYVPSERILKEGGYEGGDAMVYFDQPNRFAPGLEDRIINVALNQLPDSFRTPKATEGTAPRSPERARRSLRTKPEFEVDLVVSEPLIEDPVAIDWDLEGRLWVAEMHDYPAGLKGQYQPGGRVRLLQDTDGDGRFDQSSLFAENLPFPTGISVWNAGVLVCAAPDIIYLEDRNGDGKQDLKKTLFTGFATHNYQARVNSLQLGLDNWIYGAIGLFGGVIHSSQLGVRIEIKGRDFRMRPGTGDLEPVTGLTQQGRARDDWGNWFGCDNGTLATHYPLPDHYLRRNPHIAPPPPEVYVPDYPNANQLYPISRPLERFNDPTHLNRVTSACGLGVYRDDWLGPDYANNVFVCEPVHNLVRRLQLKTKGSTFSGKAPEAENQFEFLASDDNWFRPVQVRTGPDGALWIIDMYRFIIEHPIWIQPDRLAQLDVRAGASLGRIYRLRPAFQEPRPIPTIDRTHFRQLLSNLASANGTLRDLAHQELVALADPDSVEPLRKMVRASPRPTTRLHGLCILDGLNAMTPDILLHALDDEHPALRRHAVRLCESYLNTTPELANKLVSLIDDPSPQVRLQLACSLGECSAPEAGKALAALLLGESVDAQLQGAVFSSALLHLNTLFEEILASRSGLPPKELIVPLINTAVSGSQPEALAELIKRISSPGSRGHGEQHLIAAGVTVHGIFR